MKLVFIETIRDKSTEIMLYEPLSEIFSAAAHKRAIFAVDDASLFHALQLGTADVHEDISTLRSLRQLALGPRN